MQELIPVGLGLLLGATLASARPSIRPALGAALALVLGLMATIVTGEFEISWGFLGIDVPLVALAAFGALQAMRRLSPAHRGAR